jgi:hypothetical protein
MGREVKRVPLDFEHPLNKVWGGYLMPEELRLPQCESCGGRGYSPRALELHDLWYGYIPFKPEDNGSIPLTPETPPVREFAERNVAHAPDFYLRQVTINWSDSAQHEADIITARDLLNADPAVLTELAIRREAQRLADLWNGQWSHHVNAEDVAALVEAGRLYELTHEWVRGDGWKPKDPPVVPTPEQVNVAAIRSFMVHDAISASVVVRARCEREGVSDTCSACAGQGDCATTEQRAAHEAWTCTEPPEGEGWQLWETVSEGSPISPVFATDVDLAEWMTTNRCTVNGPMSSFEAALKFVHAGWAPSFMASAETGVISGTEWIGGEQS